MNHERALIYALAGGPVPQEALAHIGACPACASELEALRATEERLKAAAPSAAVAIGSARPPLAAPRRSHGLYPGWTAAAAAGLAIAFLAVWVGPKTPVPAAPIEAASAVRSSLPYAWPGGEYSTPAVLDAVQEELAASSAADESGTASYWTTTAEGEIP